MTLRNWQKAVHALAIEKGWYKQKRNPLELHALIMSEIGEATNEARQDKPPIYQMKPKTESDDWDTKLKPEGELIELADCVIRILDYCEFREWDLEVAMKVKHSYNKSRPYRHGNKKY